MRAQQPSHADAIQSVGIPRGLMYYRYHKLWCTFFEELGRTVIIDPPSTRATLSAGDAASVDECCLASKLYMGHVRALLDGLGTDRNGKACVPDALFIPSLANAGRHRGFCTKFQALPDLVANTFLGQQPPILSCLIEEQTSHTEAKDAFAAIGQQLGATPKETKAAFSRAKHAHEHYNTQLARAQRDLIESIQRLPFDQRPLTILVAAHPYVAHDPLMGASVTDALKSLGVEVVYADEYDHARAEKRSFAFSETLPWLVNRELIGAILDLHDVVDGIVIMSAFPCGPDSMTNDMVMRCVHGKPILNLTVDAQSGTAGIETRVESFVDILRYRHKGGYLHE